MSDDRRVPDTDIRAKRLEIERQIAKESLTRRHREPSKLLRLIIFLLGIALLLLGLSLAFPLTSGFDPYLIRSLIIIVIFGGAAAYWSRASLAKIVKVAGLWALVIAGISVFYLYRSDLGNRIMSSIDPADVTQTSEGLMVHRHSDGHFWVRASVNGIPLRMMVDTGASNIVLTPNDAEKVGIDKASLSFSEFAETANGSVLFARATLDSLQFGDMKFHDVSATVNGADMKGSLLGMSVLKRFSSIEFRGDTLILRE